MTIELLSIASIISYLSNWYNSLVNEYLPQFLELLPQLLSGAKITVFVTVISVLFGTIFGLNLSLLKLSKHRILRLPAVIYIDIVRGTPLLLQILMCYFLLPANITGIFGTDNSALFSGIIACSLNSAAYVAEIMRAGIQSINRGQMEAARSLGMNKIQAMTRIILPQALRRVIPPLGNEVIILLKDSSLLSAIGVVELVLAGKLYAAREFAFFPAYIGIAIVYLTMTITISRVIHWYEKRLGINDKSN